MKEHNSSFVEISNNDLSEINGGFAWIPVLIFVGKAAATGAISGATAYATKRILKKAFG